MQAARVRAKSAIFNTPLMLDNKIIILIKRKRAKTKISVTGQVSNDGNLAIRDNDPSSYVLQV